MKVKMAVSQPEYEGADMGRSASSWIDMAPCHWRKPKIPNHDGVVRQDVEDAKPTDDRLAYESRGEIVNSGIASPRDLHL
jgi:hypothetical protein